MADESRELAAAELERLRAGLHIMALRALGDAEAAEEATQETLARAVEALGRGRPDEPEKLGAFVAGIARHVIAATRRERRRDVALSAADPPPASQPDALAALVSSEERALVRAGLAQLSHRDRQLLRLTYFEGLTPSELALRSGEPAERIRKRKSRALERLRRILAREAPGHDARGGRTEGKDRLDALRALPRSPA